MRLGLWAMGWLALVGVPGAGAVSGDLAVDLAACDEQRTPWAQALENAAPALPATPAALAPAQALWLDAQRLQWPGQPADGRYRLVRGLHLPGGRVLVPGVGLVRNRVTDPYALSLASNSRRTWIGRLDHPALKPAGWETTARARRR
jgi:hypothetical protein